MKAPKTPVAPVALEALYVAEESYGARPVSGFADAPGRRDDIVAYADDSNLVTNIPKLISKMHLRIFKMVFLNLPRRCGMEYHLPHFVTAFLDPGTTRLHIVICSGFQ